MDKPKLNLSDLDVSSFPTTSASGTPDQLQVAKTYNYYTCTNDPTAQTFCFICPPITSPTDGCAYA